MNPTVSFTYPPRGMSNDEASRYIGVAAAQFLKMVADGRMPKPKLVDGQNIWDRNSLDDAFTSLPSFSDPADTPPTLPIDDEAIAPLLEAGSQSLLPTVRTPEEVAKHFNWSPRKLRAEARKLGACRVLGNRMVFTEKDVAAILEALRPAKPVEQLLPGGEFAALVKLREKQRRKGRVK